MENQWIVITGNESEVWGQKKVIEDLEKYNRNKDYWIVGELDNGNVTVYKIKDMRKQQGRIGKNAKNILPVREYKRMR